MKKILNYILIFSILLTTFSPSVISVQAEEAQEYTELYKMDFNDVDTVTDTTDETAFNDVYGETAQLLSPRATFKYSIAQKEEDPSDKYLFMDSDFGNNVSGFSTLHIWLPDGGLKANNGSYKISYDFKWLSAAQKPFLRVKTNHSTQEGLDADTVIVNNGGVYNWGPMLSGVAPINDSGVRDQSSPNVYGTYSTYAGTENIGWFTTSWNDEDKINLEANTWHTAETIIDTVNKKAYHYFDDIYVGCQQDSAFSANLICGNNTAKSIQIQIEQGWNVPYGYQLDNIIISHSEGEFNGSDKIKTDKAEIVDCTNERIELGDEEVNAIANKFEISVSNVVNESDVADAVTLTKEGSEIQTFENYTATDKKSGVIEVTTTDYLENGGIYTLKVFDKEYTFTISYPKQTAVAGLELIKQDNTVTDVADLTAGDEVFADIKILNPEGETTPITLVAACYDKDKLAGFYFKNVALSEDEMAITDSLKFSVPDAQELSIKIFAVDNMNSFKAISDIVEIGQTPETVSENVFDISDTDKENANKKITALIYKPGKTVDDLVENENVRDVIFTAFFKTADKTGKYSFKAGFDENDVSGVYKAYINSSEITEKRFCYVNKTENENAVDILTDSSDFVTDAKANAAALGFGEFTDEVPDEAYTILKNYYSDNTVNAQDFDTNLAAVRKSEIIACVNKGLINNIFEYSEYFTEEFADISEFMENSYFDEKLQKNITLDLKEDDSDKISDVRDSVNKHFVLNLIENSNGYENLTPVLKAFSDKIGVNKSSITNSVSKKINGNSYKSYSELKSAIKNASDSGSSGGSSGGGSRSSGSKGGISAGGIVESDANTVKEIPKNIFTDVSDDFWGRDAIVYLTERNILDGKTSTQFCPNDYVTREEFTKMIVTAFCDTKEAGEIGFSDVDKNAWYYSYIAIASSENLITGYDDLTFGISKNITRQDMAVILSRVADAYNYNFTLPEYIDRFDDDNDIADYAKDAVYSLRNAGVVKGSGDLFNPGSYATRAEAATIIYNMLTL